MVVENPDDVRGGLLLPATVNVESYKVSGSIAWRSSDPATLSIDPLTEGSTSYTTVVNRPSCGGATPVTLTATVTSDAFDQPIVKTIDALVQPVSAGDDATHSRVTSHDPGIIKANGRYYIFGSHRAFAKSTDLQHWEYFTNNLVTDYQDVLGDIWEAWPKQDTNPRPHRQHVGARGGVEPDDEQVVHVPVHQRRRRAVPEDRDGAAHRR